jgi:hypothetical protein
MLGVVGNTYHPGINVKIKIGGLWSRPTSAKSEILAPK